MLATSLARRQILTSTLILASLHPQRRGKFDPSSNQRVFAAPKAAAPMEQLHKQAQLVLDEVYGPYLANWHPKPFERTAPRYLWTDAFGVCAYLSLYHASHEDRLLRQAVALMEDVHNNLGHMRPDTTSSSSSHDHAWLPGSSDEHPTRGGLRIGKKDPEGHPDGDGQYYHYLTKWAFALSQLAAATGDNRYLSWAVELMETAHRTFVYKTRVGGKRMYWKMSIDLSRPAVSSMGNLDPYDGLITCTLLQQAAAAAATTTATDSPTGASNIALAPAGAAEGATYEAWAGAGQSVGFAWGAGKALRLSSGMLEAEVADLRAMVEERYRSYQSDDPLDLGEALWLSHWQLLDSQQAQQQQSQQQQQQQGPRGKDSAAWAPHIAATSLASLDELWKQGCFDQPVQWRLAFREFGTSIGLQALLAVMPGLSDGDVWRQRVQHIHDTWGTRLFTRDKDITPVMYATSLVPTVWLKTFQAQV